MNMNNKQQENNITFKTTIGQIQLGSTFSVINQIEETISKNPESNLYIFPEFATHGNKIELKNIPYLENEPEAVNTAQYWINLTPSFDKAKEIADKYNKAIVIGCLEQENNKLYSRAYFYDPQNNTLEHYDKAHVHWTETFLRPGNKIEPFNTRFGKIGILICYDMAFLEPTKIHNLKGAEILVVISAVPKFFSWEYTFRRLTGAAIFNQYYVLSANLGFTEKCKMGGHCAILDPKANLIELTDNDSFGYISANVDLSIVRSWKKEEVINPMRRPELYKEIAK